METISRFVKDITEHFNSITVLFTHASAGYRANKILIELAKLLKEREGQDTDLTKFLRHLMTYVNKHKENVLVNPLDSSQQPKLVEIIKSAQPLLSENNPFDLLLSYENRTLLVLHICFML